MSPASWWAPEAEREGIIRAGAEMVETMACATVPKIVLTLNHASGAGYYAMAGQGFDPNFTFGWPTARIGVMEGDSAVQARSRSGARKAESRRPAGPDRSCRIASRRPAPITSAGWTPATPPRAGTCDAVIDPLETRRVLAFALEVATAHEHREHLAAGDSVEDDPHRERTRLLGRLAGSAGAAGGAGPDRLPGARLPGRDHHVDSAEAEGGRSQSRLRARFSAADRAHRSGSFRSATSR